MSRQGEYVRNLQRFFIETIEERDGKPRLWLGGHSRGNNEFGMPSFVACAGPARVHSPRYHDEFPPQPHGDGLCK